MWGNVLRRGGVILASGGFAAGIGWAAGGDARVAHAEVLSNYSETHSCDVVVHRPSSVAELQALLRAKRRLRVVGSGLSPNGLGFPDAGAEAVSLANMDRILSLDKEEKIVTVEAGCTVRQIQDYLSDHGLTFANFSSIADQGIAGWTQVSAHGTGATLPCVEEQIVAMTLETPGLGTLTLDNSTDPELFSLAKVSLGTLGVVTSLSIQCADKALLKESVLVEPIEETFGKHAFRLRLHKHLKYLISPTERDVVVVTADPVPPGSPLATTEELPSKQPPLHFFEKLLNAVIPGGTFASYRDALLGGPSALDPDYVKKVNEAEIHYWKESQGPRVEDSFDILGFECGGYQWVYEVCLPVGTLSAPNRNELQYLSELRTLIAQHRVPAPSPIETRFTSGSSAPLSPTYSADPDALFAWIGIIMYLPPGCDREKVTQEFFRYRDLTSQLQDKYGAVPHWAKIEAADAPAVARAAARYGPALLRLKEARQRTDPQGVLSYSLVDTLTRQAEAGLQAA
ncbi:L-galactono-1 [Diplonema papillatum]|nr:L-galactono-1 [Diplonema papillatum]|eukprot:gene7831-12035_t